MPKDLVFDLSPTQSAFVESDAHIAMLMGPMGEGKCIAQGTEIILYSGKKCLVEDILVGDLLMGDDSTPRKVLSLGRGKGELFEVVPFKGEPFVCNGEHILCLKRTSQFGGIRRGRHYNESKAWKVFEYALKDYAEMSKTQKGLHKLYRVPVDFEAQPVPVDPYFLGLWLGDGSSHATHVTTADEVIADYLQHFAAQLGMRVRIDSQEGNKSSTYCITNGSSGNPLRRDLSKLGVIKNKHIPLLYKSNSRHVRMQVLAGLVDSDGYVNRNSYQFTLVSEQLAGDIAFLCRSLGFAAYVNKVTKTIKSTGFSGEYFQVGVSGDLSAVPVKLSRRRCPPRKPFKDVLMTGIKEIRTLGVGEYYGFVLDGNHRFLLGDFTVSHNTFSGAAGVVRHAHRCGQNIRAAVVRDTHQNIKISTVPSLKEIFGAWVEFHDDCKQMVIHSQPRVEADLFGIDDPASLSKLQGPEYGLIWLEEPAPIIEKANAGLPRDVFDMAIARAARQKGTRLRVQVTQNPADEDHWTEDVANMPEVYAEDETTGDRIIKQVFRIAYGENSYLNSLARLANKAAFKNDPGKYARYVEGIAAPVQRGKRVTPEYNPKIHFAGRELPVVPGALGLRFYDGWHHPVCLVAQYIPPGKIWVHNCFWGDGIGAKELCEQQVVPLVRGPKFSGKIPDWRDIGDPTMRTPDQSTTGITAARRIEQILRTRFEPGPTKWSYRIDPLRTALGTLAGDGSPVIYISQSAYDLHRALNGGWHYKSDNQGNIIGNLPVKDKSADLGDALAYGVARVLPYARQFVAPAKRNPFFNPLKRAMSYAPVRHDGRQPVVQRPAQLGMPGEITLRPGV